MLLCIGPRSVLKPNFRDEDEKKQRPECQRVRPDEQGGASHDHCTRFLTIRTRPDIAGG